MDYNTNRTGIDFQFKGSRTRSSYFEGWYLKFILDEHKTLSLIPSIHRQRQLVQGSLQTILSNNDVTATESISYPASDFNIQMPFQLQLGSNLISSRDILINEPHLKFHAQIDQVQRYPANIMGPFHYFHSIMPCNHGLLVTRGQAQVKISSELINGSYNASLYVEKDWGDSFPEQYIWVHADFPEENASLFFSVATVLVGKIKFPGFIANVFLDGKNYTFATWNLSQLKISGSATDIHIALINHDMKVIFRVQPGKTVRLHSPIDGIMNSSIREALSAPLQIIMQPATGRVIQLNTHRASVEYHHWFD